MNIWDILFEKNIVILAAKIERKFIKTFSSLVLNFMNSFEQNTNIREKLAQIVGNLTHIVNGTQVIPAIEKDIILQNLREAYVAVMQYDADAALTEAMLTEVPEQAVAESIRLKPIEAESLFTESRAEEEPQPAQPQVAPQPAAPIFVQPERKQTPFEPNFVKPEAAPQQPVQFPTESVTKTVQPKVEPATSKIDLFAFDEPKREPSQPTIPTEPVAPKIEPAVEPPISKVEPAAPEIEPAPSKTERPAAETAAKPTTENGLFPFDTPKREQPKAEPVVAKPEPVQPKPEQPKRSLNDLLTQQREDHSIGAQFQHARVSDISKAMSLNDKFLYIKVLFKDKGEDFALAIQKLNQAQTLDEAMNEIGLMQRYYKWDEASDAYTSFCELVNRKFI